MANESTINDLREALRHVEEERRQLDELYQALVTTLSYFERSEQTEGQLGDGSSSPAQSFRGILQGIRSRGAGIRQRNAGDIRGAMEDVLKSEGPLHRQDLYKRLVERGWSIGGEDPVNNMSARLSMDGRFESLGNGMWGLVGTLNEAEPQNAPESNEPPDSYGDSGDDDDSDADSVDDGEDSNTEEEDSVPW